MLRAPWVAPWIEPMGGVVIPPCGEITSEIGQQAEIVADYGIWFAVWAARPVARPLTAAVI